MSNKSSALTAALEVIFDQFFLTVGQLCALQNFVSSKNSPSVMSVKTPKKRASTKRKLVAVEDEEVIDLRDDAAESDVDVPPASAIIKSANRKFSPQVNSPPSTVTKSGRKVSLDSFLNMKNSVVEELAYEQKLKFSGPSNTFTFPKSFSCSSNNSSSNSPPPPSALLFAWKSRSERTQAVIHYLKTNKMGPAAEQVLSKAGVKQHNLVCFPANESNVSKENELMDSDDDQRYVYRESDPFVQEKMKTTVYGTKFEVFIPGALNGKGDYPYTVRGLFPEVILEEMESIDSADMHRMEPVVDLLYDQLHMMF